MARRRRWQCLAAAPSTVSPPRSKPPTAGGLAELDALTTLVVTTLNSLYRVVVLDPPRPRILIQGGTFFPEPTEAQLAGASFGGSMLKLAWLGCGLRMEVCSDGQRIVTSPVRSTT